MIAVPLIILGSACILLFLVGAAAVANDGKRAKLESALVGIGQLLVAVIGVSILWLILIAVLGFMGVRA